MTIPSQSMQIKDFHRLSPELVGAETLVDQTMSSIAHRRRPQRIVEQIGDPCRHRRDVADRNEETGRAILDYFLGPS